MINLGTLHIDRPRFRANSPTAHLVAGLIAAIAAGLRVALNPWLAGIAHLAALPYILFFPAVIAATFLCGSAAGFLAAAMSIALAWAFILPHGAALLSLYQTAIFTVGAVTVLVVVAAMRTAAAGLRRSSEMLRLSEEKFRGLLESAPEAMVIVDERHRIALVNARMEELSGYPRAELIGAPVELLVAVGSRAQFTARIAAMVTEQPSQPVGPVIDLDGRRKDGTEFSIEVSLGLLRTAAGVLVSNAIRDVTERREIEARLVEASKAKSDFLANMSHELRTPLNAIIGFSEMISNAVIGPLDARYRGYGGDINESGRHLLKIINDILDISKIEGGRLDLREEAVSIAETVEACGRIVAPMAEKAGVLLSIEVPGALPPIRSDPLRFRQILLNLMSNAVKFTPEGGRVGISATIEAREAVIAVADTGIGMRPEDVKVALQPFRQIDGALSRRFDGTGLGLPLAKALVELHGGRLDIESAPNAGTTVRIRLPADRVQNAAA